MTPKLRRKLRLRLEYSVEGGDSKALSSLPTMDRRAGGRGLEPDAAGNLWDRFLVRNFFSKWAPANPRLSSALFRPQRCKIWASNGRLQIAAITSPSPR